MLKNENLAALLAEMKAYGEENHIPLIQEAGLKILVEAVAARKPQRILEVGTAIGYSALYMLAYAALGAKIVTLEKDELRAEEARAYVDRSGYGDKVEILLGDAGEIIPTLAGPFDFVFIDAAKSQYGDYFRKVQPLLSEEAVIVTDNVLFRGYVRGRDEDVPKRYRSLVRRLREYNAMLTDNADYQTVIYEAGDGVAVSRRVKK